GGDDGMVVTVIVADPVRPSDAPLIVADPGETPVTTPDDGSTLATDVFDDCHATTRPVNTLPVASRATAVACVVAPTLMPDCASDTVTDATGADGGGVFPPPEAVTVRIALPERPSLDAITVACPADTPTVIPVSESTVATLGFDVDQRTTRPTSRLPCASRRVSLACTVSPVITDVAERSTATV